MEAAPKRLFLIDGMALLFRSFYAMGQAGLTAPDGTPIGAVYGFMRVISKILKEQAPTHFAVAWDTKEKTFRHELFPEYKANRSEPPEDIIPQIGLMQNLLKELQVPSLRLPGYEADDLIGTLALAAKPWAEVFIVSADKDFMQLVGSRVKMFSLKKGDDYVVIDDHYVEDYFGVPPSKVRDVLAIMGDKVDNVPGVFGIGEKGAAKLIQQFGSLEGVYENLDKITGKKQKEFLIASKDAAHLSRKLVEIACDVPVDVEETGLVYDYAKLQSQPALKTRLNELRMHSLLRQLLGDAAVFEKVHSSGARQSAEPGSGGQTTLFDEPTPSSASSTPVSRREEQRASWGKRNYHCVSTREELETVLSRLRSPKTPVVAFDTETTGLDFMADRPIGLSLCFEPGEAWYVPATDEHLRVDGKASALGEPAEIWALVGDALAVRKATLVAHNAKFDIHMLACVGVDVGKAPVACSMVAAWMVDAGSGGYGLDARSFSVLGLEKIPTSALIGGKDKPASMKDVPLETLSEYACEDVDATLRLWQHFEADLRDKQLFALFWELEMPLLRVLVQMERTGVHIDSQILADLTVEIQDTLMAIEQSVFEMAGEPFKLSSPKQLGAILFEKLKVHEQLGFKGKLAKTSLGFKTDAGVLEKFEEHPLVKKIQEYRELSKLLSTYVLVLPQLVKDKTGRIHTHFHQIGTATGRLSSSDPNLQNIPVRTALGRRVRGAFTSPDPDTVILAVDYSQIELRVLAELADDETMIKAFCSGADIHRETAAKVAGKAPEEVTGDERSAAKAINFGIIYGMGPQRLARDRGISLQEAKTFIDRYFMNFSRIQSFIEASRASAHEKGYAKTAFGRLRPLPQLHSKNPGEARQAENMAINSPIQGTAADIMKLGMLAVDRVLKEQNRRARMVLQVHDELVLEVPRTELELVAAEVKQALEGVVHYRVPLTVDVGSGPSWLEAK